MNRVDLLNDAEIDEAIAKMPLKVNKKPIGCEFCGKQVSKSNRHIWDERFLIIDKPVCNNCFNLWASNNVKELMEIKRKRLIK